MPTRTIQGMTFDARPDRIDFRDLQYRPPLVSLPDEYPGPELIDKYFPLYAKDGLVLDQGSEGACTGFGLAAVVNYLRWERSLKERLGKGRGGKSAARPPLVSPRMLYQNARLYDEWRGEDYDGSSCRGAVKGLHKHGVCTEGTWPYLDKTGAPGASGQDWDLEAAQCPLGAYYRIDAKSLVDMQAAINEVNAIYVSSNVHSGWMLDSRKSIEAATIRPQRSGEKLGGHAYSLVGYRPDGFIVQNSWGPGWGFSGFGLLPYDEWTKHGFDAWVLALGAPMLSVRSPASRTRLSLEERSALRARAPVEVRAAAAAKRNAVAPWIDGEEARHCVFIGHEGRPERELVEATNGPDSVRRVVEQGIRDAVASKMRHVAIYAHGGLNNREAGLTRARILGPWFEANGIFPIFVIWQTGFLEFAEDILRVVIDRIGLVPLHSDYDSLREGVFSPTG